MLLDQFYDILDKELEVLISENKSDIVSKKINQPNQQKGYVLLIWFLKIYANISFFKDYITDGKDDSSCDIIFSMKENGEEIFYVVQSKWNEKPKVKEGNEHKKISADEVKKAIVDFESIFRKDKRKGKNELFNKRLDDLQKHRIEHGGAVKFIFLGLLPHNEELNEHIRNFEANYAPCKLEIMDIERLKRDYIEFKYKQIEVNNPLSYRYTNPNEDKMVLQIERIENSMGKGDHLKIEKPYESYIFLLKPKTIYDLFRKYKFALFFNNVRNPLPESNYNQAIVDTLNRKPEMFWYFNNGITAITKLIKPVGFDSKIAELRGLQIINGAQTAYSIYSAYENASEGQRDIMDNDAKITLRLIRSSNDDMNLEITRYTNSQNPMEARDFWANEAVQIRLQEESFRTTYWYEKRRGEFRILPQNIKSIKNISFAEAYLSFFLQDPVSACDVNFEKKLFTSRKEHVDGLYEYVFHTNITFDDMLLSWQIFHHVVLQFAHSSKNNKSFGEFVAIATGKSTSFDTIILLALYKTILEKYIASKFNSDTLNINRIVRQFWKENLLLNPLSKICLFVVDLSYKFLAENPNELKYEGDKWSSFSKLTFEKLKDYFEKTPINADEIDKIIIAKQIK